MSKFTIDYDKDGDCRIRYEPEGDAIKLLGGKTLYKYGQRNNQE